MLQFIGYEHASRAVSACFEAGLVEELPFFARPPGAGFYGVGNNPTYFLPKRRD